MFSPVMAFHISGSIQVPLLYISTDYVFDGKSPPYAVDAVPSPLNLYGKTKLDGEKVTLDVGKGNIFMTDNKYSATCNICMGFVCNIHGIEVKITTYRKIISVQ
jgi:nucleoside-diphosphate-sugar epimerase